MPRLARISLWLIVSLLGATAVGIAAFQRNEPVNALWLVATGLTGPALAAAKTSLLNARIDVVITSNLR